MDTISDYMIEQNRLFHKDRPDYGTFSGKWVKGIEAVVEKFNIETILDYGAGKQSLKKDFPNIQSYDPGIEEISTPPNSADLVICTHVLEHVEPDLLPNVLRHINRLANKAFFITVNSGPSGKILPDGRDSNLIQESVEWWTDRLNELGNFNVWRLNRQKFNKGFLEFHVDKKTGTFLGARY